MHGISAIIAVVLILLITVSLGATLYIFFSQVFSETTTTQSGISQITTGMTQNFVIEAVRGTNITIRNTGQIPITNFAIYVDEKPVNFTNSSAVIQPGAIYTFFVYDFIDYSYPRTLKITVPGIVQSIQVGRENMYTDLIGYWKFDEGSGIIAKDSSLYGNDGILIGGTNISWNTSIYCKYNSCLSFYNGTGSGNQGGGIINISYSQTLDLQNGVTIEFWIYNNTPGVFGIIERGPGGCSYPYEIFITAKPHFRITNSSLICIQLDGIDLNPNMLNYVAGIYNNTAMILYTNNIFTIRSHFGDIRKINNPLGIGATINRAWSFNGTIDDVRIWNRALTPEEIYNHYIHGPI